MTSTSFCPSLNFWIFYFININTVYIIAAIMIFIMLLTILLTNKQEKMLVRMVGLVIDS